MENMKYLEKCMKKLPNNLQILVLSLSGNNLGENIKNIKHLRNGM